jgi:heme/copper-type cytochrome/quinol oxidase subunit 3
VGAAVLGLGVLVSLWNFAMSRMRGAAAGPNPWNADTLEWSTTSPPEDYNFEHLPLVRTRHPLWDRSDQASDPSGARVFDGGRFTLSTGWLEAEPLALARMPDDTLLPFFAALTLTLLAFSVLEKSLAGTIASAVMTALIVAGWLWPEEEKKPSTPLGPEDRRVPLVADIDQKRGVGGMVLFIASEAMLFVMLFFSYFYLGPFREQAPPKLTMALCMLALLATSSGTLHWGVRRSERAGSGPPRAELAATIFLGGIFVALQFVEYGDHLRTLTPQASAYGSIFYALTGLHGMHLIVGLGMLAYAAALPRLTATSKPPHCALRAVSWYWHFVDAAWFVIVAVLYVAPNLSR